MKEWKWDQTWGWDYPMTAMTAARLGETGIAIDALLLESEKNRYLPNGPTGSERICLAICRVTGLFTPWR